MDILDDMNALQKHDPSGVLASTALFFDQCTQAWKESSVLEFPDPYKKVINSIVVGMGGSRFTPRTVKELYKDEIKIPYEINDDYRLPSYVGEETLIILSSYSGTTEEVLACAREAFDKKARVTAIAKGGPISQIIKDKSLPGYIFDPVHNPCGQPRIGSGYLLLGHMGILKALGLLDVSDTEVMSAIDEAKKEMIHYGPGIPTANNPAKQLARKLYDTHPFLICSEFLRGWGNCFANQINETAKMVSDYRYIPELNHHLMEGLKHPDDLNKHALFVFIHSNLYHPANVKRMLLTENIIEKQGYKTHVIGMKGHTKLTQVLEGFVLSGYASFYLAMLYGSDPVAIPWVDYFKSELSKG